MTSFDVSDVANAMRGIRIRGGTGLLVALGLMLGACGTTHYAAPPPTTPKGGQYKVGNPYTVNGVTYVPRAQPGYDQTGTASWYGPQFHGRYTANGELFDMNKLTAAHRTLPMPSYVRVTNLQNGRSLVLRINDRGPFAKNRIIDVSRRAAQLLGFERSGTAKVRVQAVVEKADAPDELPPAKPDNDVFVRAAAETAPAAGPTPPPSAAGLFVQVGAFGTEDKAKEIQDRASALGPATIAPIVIDGRTLYRVRLGPYGSDEAAEGVRAEVSANGFPDARIVND